MQKTCNMCGKTFDISNFYKNRNSYDGKCKQCRNKLRNTRYTLTCEHCGKEFTSARKNTKYCSKKCVNNSRKNRVTIKCEICGEPVTRQKSQFNGTHVYCSYECQAKGWSKYYSGENSPSYNPNLSDEERIKERHYQEYYKWRDDAYERDKYTCQCCGDNKGHNLNAHHIFNYSEHENLRTNINNGITLCDKCHKLYHDTYGYKHNNYKELNEFLNRYKNQAS
ncbi:HNH endonuclease [Clostridium algidicarnis]|uniref:HNH endonuclease n=1 Tax=Clostridium algidicarnis TaxID=37659 RepID=UPI001FD0976E|nr:HNH endonuclease [Clostridium algidicarnis]